jgi:signal transduction histidine kinase
MVDMKKERETARLKLAREIHDDIGQPLTAAKLIIERLRISPDNYETLLEQVRGLISEAQVKAGSLCRELQEEPKAGTGTSANRKARG